MANMTTLQYAQAAQAKYPTSPAAWMNNTEALAATECKSTIAEIKQLVKVAAYGDGKAMRAELVRMFPETYDTGDGDRFANDETSMRIHILREINSMIEDL